MEYYSSIKRNEVMTHAMIWINFINSMLSEKKPDKKDNIFYYPIYTKCPENENP
jgi:hypothetical protein